jgi:predicted small secreted protein
MRLSTSLPPMNTKLALLTLAAALGLASCNTISGIGKDVESVGSKIDNASQATRESMQ